MVWGRGEGTSSPSQAPTEKAAGTLSAEANEERPQEGRRGQAPSLELVYGSRTYVRHQGIRAGVKSGERE